MKISVISQIEKGEEILINPKGYEEIEIDATNDITAFSFNKKYRYVGIKGVLYRLSLKSYIELKKFLRKINSRYVR